MSSEGKRYWAFLSYSHKDEPWGSWLHHSLERYRIPRRLAGRVTARGAVPRRIFPCFRDQEELQASPNLSDEIRSALEKSLFLIVVCSPRAAQSRWVNEEIRFFKALGREQQVLCLIVDGEPNAPETEHEAAEEAFPEAARFRVTSDGLISEERVDPLAADVRPGHDSKKDARLRLVAGILGLGFDELKRRDRRRSLLQRMLAVASAVILLAAGTGLLIREARRSELEARNTASRELARQALSNKTSAPELSLLLSIEAYRQSPTPEALDSLLRGIQQNGASMISFLQGHTAMVRSADFSPDGRVLATSSGDAGSAGEIILWDPGSRLEIRRLHGHRYSVNALQFSRDGSLLLSGSDDGTVVIWDTKNWEMSGMPLEQPSTPTSGIALPPLSGGGLNAIRAMALSPDGTELATGDFSGKIVLWDLRTRKVIRELTYAVDGVVNELHFHPSGNMLAVTCSVSQPALVWDISGHSLQGRIGGHGSAGVASARFSADGRLLATGHADGTISFWDVRHWERVPEPIPAHEKGVTAITFSPNGRLLASAGQNNEIRLWEVASHRSLGESLVGHNRPALCLAFAPDSLTLASGGEDRTVILWDPARRILPGRLVSESGAVAHSVALSPVRPLLAVGTTEGVKLWNLESSDASAEALGPAETDVTGVAFSPDGTVLATGAADGGIALWDVAARQPLGADRGPYDPLPPASFSGQRGPITSLAFDPDGTRLASASAKQSLYIWALRSGSAAAKEILAHPWYVSAVVYLPDGRALISAGGDGVTVRSPVDLSVEKGPFEGQAEVISLDYAAATETLAVGRKDGVVAIWDANGWEPRGTLEPAPSSPVRSVAFRGDGRVLATGMQQGGVRLWDLRANRAIGAPLSGHHSAVAGLAFDFKGKKLVSADEGGTVIEWDVDPESWIDLACEKANRNLRAEEWRTYLGDSDYRPTCPSRPVRPDAPDYRPRPPIRAFEIEVSSINLGRTAAAN